MWSYDHVNTDRPSLRTKPGPSNAAKSTKMLTHESLMVLMSEARVLKVIMS